ncbi:DUF4269 domain-containing protein [Alkalicoccobacillus gibsonii]|uniref:DUF4269 domain-containing protein n=1 Tax=Alkalicoccobacillus gibsonii TaxID=79881 RepID=A0ABU9VDX4_9BACI
MVSLDLLREGTAKQQSVYRVIQDLHIMETWSMYSPVLSGTIPINIDLDTSDLDIIMEINTSNHGKVQQEMKRLYQGFQGFHTKRYEVRGIPTLKANFNYQGFEFELFAQPVPVTEQNAYVHMVIEAALLKEDDSMREQILNLKRAGMKTEPAFCEVLGLKGDAYDELIQYGKRRGII